jgi:hypothetical protein
MLGRVLGARFWGSGVKKWWCKAKPTPLINKERGIKVGFICLGLHHPTLSSAVLPKHPTKEPNSREYHKTCQEKDCRYSDGLGDLLVSFPLSPQSQPLHPSSTSPPVMELPLGKDQTSEQRSP